MAELHLEDLVPGQVHPLGRQTLSQADIVAFARAYDPQAFHLDEAAAAQTIYGGLIASGWQTICVFMRLFVDGFLDRAAAMGSPGVDEVRWPRPVRPGDTLIGRIEVISVRPSDSRPDRGLARLRCIAANQDGDDVMSFIANVLFARRPPTRD